MSIIPSKAPEGGYQVVSDALADLASRPRVQSLLSNEVTTQASEPIPVCLLRPELKSSIAKPTVVGWRYLVTQGRAVAAADVHKSPSGEPPKFGRLTHGFAVERLVKALQYAGKHLRERRTSYEIMIAETPEVHCSALWARPRVSRTSRQSPSLFIPYLDGTPKGPKIRIARGYLTYLRNRLATSRKLQPRGP